METVTMAEFQRLPGRCLVLVDLETVVHYARSDYATRNVNLQAGRRLCPQCNGTGNQLWVMYQRCTACHGAGEGEVMGDTMCQQTWTDSTLCCAYCGHDLSMANPVTYIDGESVCAMCRAQMEGLRRSRVPGLHPGAIEITDDEQVTVSFG